MSIENDDAEGAEFFILIDTDVPFAIPKIEVNLVDFVVLHIKRNWILLITSS